jgi:hypothetical protein
LAGDDVEVVDHRDSAKVEQVLSRAEVAGTPALPAADMSQGVLDLDPLAQLGAPMGVVCAARSSVSSRWSGWICTLRPRVLVVHWVRSGQAWQAPAGNWTLPPGVNGICWPAGQVSS